MIHSIIQAGVLPEELVKWTRPVRMLRIDKALLALTKFPNLIKLLARHSKSTVERYVHKMQSVIKFFNKQATKLEMQHKKALKAELEGWDKFKDAAEVYGYYRT